MTTCGTQRGAGPCWRPWQQVLATNGSLYRLLAEYGLRIARAQQDITSGFSPRPICELLQIKPTVPTLQIERITYLENGQPLECVFSAYRSDRYTFHVEMSR